MVTLIAFGAVALRYRKRAIMGSVRVAWFLKKGALGGRSPGAEPKKKKKTLRHSRLLSLPLETDACKKTEKLKPGTMGKQDHDVTASCHVEHRGRIWGRLFYIFIFFVVLKDTLRLYAIIQLLGIKGWGTFKNTTVSIE